MIKHVAKIMNTDQRCVVVLMQIPQRENHALVVPTDTLPPRFEQALMETLQSNEGQAVENLYDVLGRRLMPDNGRTVLQTLHESGYLVAVPIENVLMLPMPNMPFPLVTVLKQMGRNVGTATVPVEQAHKFDQHAVNRKANSVQENQNIAKNLLIEASLLEQTVISKRNQAYEYAPEFKPVEVLQFNSEPLKSEPQVLVEDKPADKPKVTKPKVTRAKKQA